MISDLKYSLRQLLRNSGFTIIALLSLALGLGANVTIFSVANGLLFQPMSVPRPREIVRIYNGHHSPFSYRDFSFFREHNTVLSHMIGESVVGAALMSDGVPEAVNVSMASGNIFAALELRPALGKLFSRTNDIPAATPEVVLAYGFWQRRFGGDPGVIGQEVQLNGSAYSVTGVAPEHFGSSVYGWQSDMFVPFGDVRGIIGTPIDSVGGSLYTSGRLKGGITLPAANTNFGVVMSQLATALPDEHDGMTVRLLPALGVVEEMRGPVMAASGFLLVVAALVLVIACANVGNMLLARNSGRRREIGIRLAMGASRLRLVRQFLTESLLLSVAGGALAILIASWSVGYFERLIPTDIPASYSFAPDIRVAGFAALLCVITIFLFGLAPALQAITPDVVTTIRDDARQGSPRRTRLRRAFLVAQISLCTVLLVGASLFLRSLQEARVIDPGFETAGLLDARVDLGTARYDEARGVAYYERLIEEVRRTPGVAGATLAALVPLSGSNMQTTIYREGDTPRRRGERERSVYLNAVGTDYFRTMGIALASGREFTTGDRAGAGDVAIINETAAAKLWPGESPIGKRLSFGGSEGPWIEVVGIAHTVKYNTLGEDPPVFLYRPLAQFYRPAMVVTARLAEGAPAREVGTALAATVRTLDPALAPAVVKTMTDEQQVVLLPAKVGATLLGVFGFLALLLASVGIFGVASYAVVQRTREIGIRSALGARAGDVIRAVLGETGRTVGIGGLIGLVTALAGARLLSSQLYGVSPTDPITFAGVPLILGVVALVACYLPARRALRVDPVVALRAE